MRLGMKIPSMLKDNDIDVMDVADELTGVLTPPLQKFQSSTILKLILGFCWYLLHLVVSIVHMASCLNQLLLSCIISTGLLSKYQNLQLDNLKCLAIVVDSEEARDTTKIKQLLCWLSSINIQHITLYDMQGVLKKAIANDLKSLTSMTVRPCSDDDAQTISSQFKMDKMTIEILSFSDGKEGIGKAASFLCSKYIRGDFVSCNRSEPTFEESEVTSALKAIGYGGPEPELLLVYGPARCHLGFPAWRLRYTEIVHMGSLRSMNYGAVVKAIYDFSKKHQNYGK
ncbi:dehydrodolichyl diphosphate synthase complex subunit NUS1 isoform X3 [Canna indica]|uniref:ditrans,polycis-polyprenyl diphosphate synthase [(2E,6E)-farnesyldiphosphate specific] n=1 Tax=Canna indica TaxID=4628 RepID=A0AAQ3JN90_9LILI|nr:dehydrodolichyl diphosphate synthase complex subunit NUS1 isoform X3 [Canna indica]